MLSNSEVSDEAAVIKKFFFYQHVFYNSALIYETISLMLSWDTLNQRTHKRVFYENIENEVCDGDGKTTSKYFLPATAEEMIVPRMVAGKICASAVKIPRMTDGQRAVRMMFRKAPLSHEVCDLNRIGRIAVKSYDTPDQ